MERELHYYFWQMPGEYDSRTALWPTFRGDPQRTGWYRPRLTSPRPQLQVFFASPNPFATHTRVPYNLHDALGVGIRVFDVRGRVVRRLVDRREGPGRHEASWDGRDDAGRPLPAGTYFLQLNLDGRTETRKAVLLR